MLNEPSARRYIIIIGAMKSGTTTLFDALARHPQIAPASNKEPGFFAFEGVHAKGWDWFDGLFDYDPAKHLWRLEASTDYTKAPFATGVWERMTADPTVDVKLLYIMRHPMRRIESHARHVQTARKELGQEISPIADHSLDQGISPVNLAASLYARQLDAYSEARAKGRLHCLTLEGLQTDPDTVMGEVLSFLGLDPFPSEEAELPRSNTAEGKTKVHPAWKYVAKSGPILAAAKTVLPPSIRQTIKERFRQKVRAEGRFAMTPQEEAFAKDLYAADLKRLAQEYGVDTQRYWDLSP